MLTSKMYAVSLVQGASKVTSVYREGTAHEALEFSNNTLRDIKHIYSEGKKPENIKALENEGFWKYEGIPMAKVTLEMRDNAIGQLRANVRKASSRLKDVEGHWLQALVMKFKLKNGFYLEDRPEEEEKPEEKPEENSVTVTEDDKLKAELVEQANKVEIYKALLEKAMKSIKNKALQEEIVAALAA